MKKISDAVIRRLPKYYRHLAELEREGIEKISSSELSKKMGLNASQIRQDFNCFGGFGQQGFGYYVKVLKGEIQSILGLKNQYQAIIVGMGNIGQALASYDNFAREGFFVLGAFDVSEDLVGRSVTGIPIMPIEELQSFVGQNEVDLGIICTPEQYAAQTAQTLSDCGVKAIWNFAPIDIQVEDSIVENVHLSDSLYILSYRMNEQRRLDDMKE
ncbi:MAG: redox-sensing transcriptional repressor Rex [Christensenellales bacterium]